MNGVITHGMSTRGFDCRAGLKDPQFVRPGPTTYECQLCESHKGHSPLSGVPDKVSSNRVSLEVDLFCRAAFVNEKDMRSHAVLYVLAPIPAYSLEHASGLWTV